MIVLQQREDLNGLPIPAQDLLITIKDGKDQLLELFKALPNMFLSTTLTNSHLEFCIDVAQNLLSKSGGQIFVF